jgi:type IV secretory pathway TrbF-like protein
MQRADTWFAVLMIALVILIGGGLWYVSQRSESPVYAPVEVAGSQVEVVQANTETRTITLKVNMQTAGFIGLHQAVGQAPGPQITVSSLLDTGDYSDLRLSMPVSASAQDFFILMFQDDGDGQYEPGVDLPVMSDGQVIKVPISL